MDNEIKKIMAKESGLTLSDVESIWDELKLTKWYLDIKNRLELQRAVNDFKLALGDMIYNSRLFQLFIKIYSKIF